MSLNRPDLPLTAYNFFPFLLLSIVRFMSLTSRNSGGYAVKEEKSPAYPQKETTDEGESLNSSGLSLSSVALKLLASKTTSTSRLSRPSLRHLPSLPPHSPLSPLTPTTDAE